MTSSDSSSNYDSDRQMIILYYCYPPTQISPHQLEFHANFHKLICQQLSLGGRIRVSTEGINGVLSGREVNLRAYDAELRKELMAMLYPDTDTDTSCRLAMKNGEDDPTKSWLDVKYCHLRKDIPTEKQLFDTLSVKITKEVVSLIEPAAGYDKNYKGRARCRQRRRQRRREKQNLCDSDIQKETATTRESDAEVDQREDTTIDPTTSSQDNYCFTNSNNAHSQAIPSHEVTVETGTVVQIKDWEKHTPAVHLSPMEWNDKLLQYSKKKSVHTNDDSINNNDNSNHDSSVGDDDDEVILLDTRNIYETRIGHFAVPKLETFFPNTRKFSSLPQALNTEEAASALSGKQVFMYCTGGVRCERAGSYLRALSESNIGAWKGKDRPKGIYQLRGGIQNYLATYGTTQQFKDDDDDDDDTISANNDSELGSDRTCLYRGKNFVFDPRRTDPVIGEGIANVDDGDVHFTSMERLSHVGQCIICTSPHDDYDNGHFPAEEKEARCCRCRVLVLICNNCRQRVRCWGEPNDDTLSKVDLYCAGAECVDEGNVAEKVKIAQY